MNMIDLLEEKHIKEVERLVRFSYRILKKDDVSFDELWMCSRAKIAKVKTHDQMLKFISLSPL